MPSPNPERRRWAALAMSLTVLHDRGLVDVDALLEMCQAREAGHPLTRDHLVAVFGAAAIAALVPPEAP